MNKDYIKNIDGAERRFFASEVRMEKREEDSSLGVIEGYAAKFNSETTIGVFWQFREKILPGAFDEVLQDDIRALFNHDPNQILARSNKGQGTLTLSVDDIGLKYSFVTPDRSYARDLQDAIEKGDVSQSSFGFKIKEQRWIEREGELELREIVKFEKLFDVSPVTYPAYTDTEVAKRSLDSEKEIRNQNVNQPEEVRGNNDKGLSPFEAQIIINLNS
jgi:HK97 family phage prohead protease